MAYTLPTFNLSCNIYSWVAPPGPLVVVRLSPECNLQMSRRVNTGYFTADSFYDGVRMQMYLLLPPLTDIRPSKCVGYDSPVADLVECPAGSGRIYQVVDVDDVGKGFSNEFRVASVYGTAQYGAWPTPIP